MTINTRKQAMAEARGTTHNGKGWCQQVTRGWFNAPSAGDQDHDGDADAKDGWLSEPLHARHVGDRTPPPGVPLYFEKDGGKGFGHRCISWDNKGLTRSTDMDDGKYAPTVTGFATISEIERAMGVKYVGWSETIDGYTIPAEPLPPKPVLPVKPRRSLVTQFKEGGPPRYDVRLLDRAVMNGRTGTVKTSRDRIDKAVRSLPMDDHNTLVEQFRTYYNVHRILRMGLLTRAVQNGRTGKVKAARDEIRDAIHDLPEH
jgi:hypothetical protein